MIESLYFTYIPQMPLIDEFKKEVNDNILKFEESFSKKDKDFSDKLTSLQTLLGSSQASATQIEGIKNNVISSETKILSIQSEYEAYKNKYIEVEREYEELLSSINADKNRLGNSIIELDKLKKSKKDELNVLIEELDDEKENIKDI